MDGHPQSSGPDGLHLGQLGLPNSNSQPVSAATVSSMASYDQDILDEHTSNIRAEVKKVLPPWSSIAEIQIWLASQVDELSQLLGMFLREYQKLSAQGAISVSAKYFETLHAIITSTSGWFGSDSAEAVELRGKLVKCVYYLKHHLSNAISALCHHLEVFVVVEKQLYSKMRARKHKQSPKKVTGNPNNASPGLLASSRIHKFLYRGSDHATADIDVTVSSDSFDAWTSNPTREFSTGKKSVGYSKLPRASPSSNSNKSGSIKANGKGPMAKSKLSPSMLELNEQFDSINSTANGIGIGVSPRANPSKSSPAGYHDNYIRTKSNKLDDHNEIPFSSPSIKSTKKMTMEQENMSYVSLSQTSPGKTSGKNHNYQVESMLHKKNYNSGGSSHTRVITSPSKKSPKKKKKSQGNSLQASKSMSNGDAQGRSFDKKKEKDNMLVDATELKASPASATTRQRSKRLGSPTLSTASSKSSPSNKERFLKSAIKAGSQVVLKSGKEAIVRFIGKTHFAKGLWYGVELTGKDSGAGRHNGRVDDVQYFRCANDSAGDHGLFIQLSRIKDMKSKVVKRKAWTLKDTPKTLVTKSQYVPSKLPEDVMKKIGEKLRAACFRVSKTNKVASSILPWLEVGSINGGDHRHLQMTISEIKKAFRQKGVTRRLISEEDMDDFLLSFSNELYTNSTMSRKDIPSTSILVSKLASFLNAARSTNNKFQPVDGFTVPGTEYSREKSRSATSLQTRAKETPRIRSSTMLASKGRRGAFDADNAGPGLISNTSPFDLSNDQKLLVAIQDGLEYVYQMQTDVKKGTSPRVGLSSPATHRTQRKKSSAYPGREGKRVKARNGSPLKSKPRNGNSSSKSGIHKEKQPRQKAERTNILRSAEKANSSNQGQKRTPRRRPPPVPSTVPLPEPPRPDVTQVGLQEQNRSQDPVSDLVLQILGPPPEEL